MKKNACYEAVLWCDLIPVTEDVNLYYHIPEGLDGSKFM